MSDGDRPVKITIGFSGGQVLPARVKPSELEVLRSALGGSGGWHQLQAEDGLLLLDLTKIDYLMLAQDEHRVGF